MQRDSLGEMPQGEEAPDPGRKPALNFPLHLLLGMKQTPLGPECPLQPRPCVPAGRFVSGLTQPSPHCVFRTVIPGRVFSSQAVHLQIQCVLSVVSGDGESALHRVCVVGATAMTANTCHLLQSLPGSLEDPVHVEATEGEPRVCTGESQRPTGCTRPPPDSTSCPSPWTPANTKTSGSENCHTRTEVPSHPQHLLFWKTYLVKEPQGPPSSAQTPWHVVCVQS